VWLGRHQWLTRNHVPTFFTRVPDYFPIRFRYAELWPEEKHNSRGDEFTITNHFGVYDVYFSERHSNTSWLESFWRNITLTIIHQTSDTMSGIQKLKAIYPWIQTPFIVGAPMRLISLADLAVSISRAGKQTLSQSLPSFVRFYGTCP
jgi:hypothetical protein